MWRTLNCSKISFRRDLQKSVSAEKLHTSFASTKYTITLKIKDKHKLSAGKIFRWLLVYKKTCKMDTVGVMFQLVQYKYVGKARLFQSQKYQWHHILLLFILIRQEVVFHELQWAQLKCEPLLSSICKSWGISHTFNNQVNDGATAYSLRFWKSTCFQ